MHKRGSEHISRDEEEELPRKRQYTSNLTNWLYNKEKTVRVWAVIDGCSVDNAMCFIYRYTTKDDWLHPSYSRMPLTIAEWEALSNPGKIVWDQGDGGAPLVMFLPVADSAPPIQVDMSFEFRQLFKTALAKTVRTWRNWIQRERNKLALACKVLKDGFDFDADVTSVIKSF